MTREEAIYILKNAAWLGTDKDREETEQAVEMAIKLLSSDKERVISDLIRREDALKAIDYRRKTANIDGRIILDEVDDRIKELPSAEPKTGKENELKFYYVESIDDYWIGARVDNFYYADWHDGLGFVWSHSRYLPWGEHIVDENTLWKEHTYPSEPIEIPFTEWVVGFVKKYFAESKKAEWIPVSERLPEKDGHYLCTITKPQYIDGIYVKLIYWCGRWYGCEKKEVVAWMPLPEPYKGGEAE